MRLQKFAVGTIAILETSKNWGPDTFNEITDLSEALGLSCINEDGNFVASPLTR